MSEKHLPDQTTPIEGAELAPRPAPGTLTTRQALARVRATELDHTDRISVEGLEVFANHGVYPEENVLGQKFVVSLTLFAELGAAGRTDDLDKSIDYGTVCHLVDAYLRERTFKLIEAAAEGVASELLGKYPQLLGVRVRLEKPWAPIGLPLASVAVEIERVRG